MEKYHKIQTILLRDPETKFKTLLPEQWATPEFEYLKNNNWLYTEKVDGTNIRVSWECGDGDISCCRKFGGRTDDAQIPTFLYCRLEELFPVEKLKGLYPETSMVLYGEGYGAKIQKGGGNYISDGVDFILFDIEINGNYLDWDNVLDIAGKLGINTVPILGTGGLEAAIVMTENKVYASKLRSTPPEGMVLRPKVELKNRRGERIITKIKLKDFCTLRAKP